MALGFGGPQLCSMEENAYIKRGLVIADGEKSLAITSPRFLSLNFSSLGIKTANFPSP